MHNKFVNDRSLGWKAISVASPQGCPLQRRYGPIKFELDIMIYHGCINE